MSNASDLLDLIVKSVVARYDGDLTKSNEDPRDGERNACARRLNSRLTKKAAAGFSSGRCHETPLKAPREFKMLTARPRIRGQSALHFRHLLLLLRLCRGGSHDMIPFLR
jgi:hypothetical protein